MISSIVLLDKYNIAVSNANKVNVKGTILSVDKEIPFVRYRFNSYDESSVSYIKSTMQKFPKSTHLVEMQYSDSITNIVNMIVSNFDNIAKFIYVEVTDAEVSVGSIGADKLAVLSQIPQSSYDRLMIKDKSTTLSLVTLRPIMKEIVSTLNIKENKVGVCSSPLSFGDLACLTAVNARDLMSRYSKVSDVALPSANHQCMNCCGCIRYIVVDCEIDSVTDSKTSNKKSTSKEKSDATPKQLKQSKSSRVFIPGQFNL